MNNTQTNILLDCPSASMMNQSRLAFVQTKTDMSKHNSNRRTPVDFGGKNQDLIEVTSAKQSMPKIPQITIPNAKINRSVVQASELCQSPVPIKPVIKPIP